MLNKSIRSKCAGSELIQVIYPYSHIENVIQRVMAFFNEAFIRLNFIRGCAQSALRLQLVSTQLPGFVHVAVFVTKSQVRRREGEFCEEMKLHL